MTKPVILCIDDQREVLAALEKDLEPLTTHLDLVTCESAEEARQALDDLETAGEPIALIISDHVMPGTTGVELLIQITHAHRLENTRKMLLTGLATHEDTIRAINEAKIDKYIAKPWQPEELIEAIRQQVTHFVFDAMPDDYMTYRAVMDGEAMMQRMRER